MENADLVFENNSFSKKSSENDVRHIGSNILKIFSEEREPDKRREHLKTAFSQFDADVISLQEVCSTWKGQYAIEGLFLELGYKMAPLETDRCCVPVLYRDSTLSLIETGFDTYRATDKIGAFKCYKWSLFEQKCTGKRFIGISTHLIAGNRGEIRKQSAIQLSDAIAELEKKYGVPAVVCGDFNSALSSDVYAIMKNGLLSAREHCPIRVNMEYNSENHPCKPPKTDGIVIDHCFYSKSGINAKRFETVITPYSCAYSDHVPICFDFELI